MNKLSFETGIEEFEINGGGVLRFNPTDPGLYARFGAFCEALPGLVAEAAGGADDGTAEEPGAFLARMQQADLDVKAKLGEVFGPGSDVNGALAGVNLLGLTAGGATVLENLMAALGPVLEQRAQARRAELELRAAKARREAEAARKARKG